MDLIQIYLKNSNKLTIITLPGPISLHFCCFYWKNFPLVDPYPHIECGSGSRRENECRSMWIRIHNPGEIEGGHPPSLPMQFSSKNILFCNNLYKVFFLCSEKGICLPTVFLWLLFVYIEVSGLSQSFLLYDSFFIKY